MKKMKWLIWTLVLVAAGVGIWFWKFKEDKITIYLNTEQPTYGTIATTVTATGTLQPVDTVAVGAQVSGTIVKVYVDFNSTVKKGQLLAQLDKSLLQAQVDQINANLQQAKSNLVYQQSNYDRQNNLYKVGAIAKAELETALYQYNAAKDNVNSVAAQLTSARRNLQFTEIYSPIDGTVLSRSVSEGQTVASSFNTPTLFSIAKDLTNMQVQASVDEADIGSVVKGQRVSFTVDAFPEDTFAGRVKEIRLQPSTSANVVSYTTIIDAPNQDKRLKPGMTASIFVYTEEVQHALLVSASAFQFEPDTVLKKIYKIDRSASGGRESGERTGGGRGGGPRGGEPDSDSDGPPSPDSSVRKKTITAHVWVKQDTTLVRKRVVTSMDTETEREVLSGLTTNDIVVLGYEALKGKEKPKVTSPFMPQRRGGNRSTGGGGGGGGNRPPQ
ncbi:efflux RND transporter periplasmic adaptor subunit [Paraflavitalea pollutisoli]|uniref:efflux RND transporter periplasmic adaptor subunit n=1 Tax=Paraflavitalea pollutisoli TaxID=3034143 RepID=UPI0023ECDF34|nr:efflux RND transporter periplasmic adaptor subunit [Paraflavitalea sp. H1-2-19X]